MNKEERAKLNELLKKANKKNEVQIVEEKKIFYWKAKEQRMIKWYMQGE